MADNQKYKCSSCGGVMEFDVKTQTLKCPNCGTEIKIINDQKKVEEHDLTRASTQMIKVAEKKSKTMECKSCGAKVEVDATSTATECPYCGTPFVMAEKQEDVVIPDGVIPFKVERAEAGHLFEQWIQKRWLAPHALKNLYQNDKLQGIYLPYWTFDAEAEAYYTAEGGRNREVKRKDREGNVVTETVTDWYYTKGTVNESFDDILIRASEKLDKHILESIEPFDMSAIASYSPDYFSGFQAECCSRDLSDAHSEAVQRMNASLENDAALDVRRQFDEVRNLHIQPDYSGETYKQVILPVYTTTYEYNSRKYNVIINGQTGRISGGYPKSPIKIGLIAAAVILLCVLAYMFFIKGKQSSEYEEDDYYYYGYQMSENEQLACSGTDEFSDVLFLEM